LFPQLKKIIFMRRRRRLAVSFPSHVNEDDDEGVFDDVDDGRNVVPRVDEDDHNNLGWSHPIVPVPEETINRATMVKNTLLSDSSLKSYVSLLSQFADYCAHSYPHLLTDDLRSKIEPLDESEWKRFARNYAKTTPKPPSSMFKLDRISKVFCTWVTSLKVTKKNGQTKEASYSLRNSCRSAMVWLFTLFNEPTSTFDVQANLTLHELKVDHTKRVAQGFGSVKRGKDPLSFEGYCNIADVLIKSIDSKALFTHTVFTTMWNLMSRVGNAVKICKSHLQWSEDALLIFFANEKTDQTQSKPGDPRHIYANPYQPAICPILSLGIFFLVIDITSSPGNFVFSGESQYCRFQNSLSQFVKAQMLGHGLDSFGTHSIRKGSATYTSSGCTSCPPFIAVSNRAGWALGGVTSIYLQYQAAGDQYVGRTVCGLNPLDPTFAVLPPRFKPDFDPNPLLSVLFSNFWGVSPELRVVLTMTTASVLYHFDWIRSNLPPGHPFLETAIFRTDFGRPISEMVECHIWAPGDTVQATGIPPHVSLLLHMSEMMKCMKAMPNELRQAMNDRLVEHYGFLNVASAEQVKAIMVDAFREVCREKDAAQREPEAEQSEQSVARSRLPRLYLSDQNKLTMLPPDFDLPHGTLKNAWIHYCCWDEAKRIPPLRLVHGSDMKKSLRSRFARYKKIMEAIIAKAKEQNVWVEPEDIHTAADILNKVDLSQIIPATTAKHRPRRLEQLSWATLAKDFYKSQRHLPESQAEQDDGDNTDPEDGDVDEDDEL